MDTQLVVLGGGPGGYAAAFLAADLGMQVTVVDLEPRLGGVCLLRGCIPSKALLHVAKAIGEAAHLGDWGVSFADPQIDLDAMRARKDKVIATLTGGLKQLAKKRGVQVIQAKAIFNNSQSLRLETGRRPIARGCQAPLPPLHRGHRLQPDVAAGLQAAHAASNGFHRRVGAARRA